MTLKELYDQTPVAEHGNITVSGDRVYTRTAEGVEEYLLMPDGKLRLLRSDLLLGKDMSALRSDIAKIKAKMGA